MSPRPGDPLGLRPEPDSTGPKTGRAPAPGVGAAAGTGNIDAPRRAATRSSQDVVSAEDRRDARKASQVSAADLLEENTREDLYERAQELDIEGRSGMDKDELAEAIAEAESS